MWLLSFRETDQYKWSGVNAKSWPCKRNSTCSLFLSIRKTQNEKKADWGNSFKQLSFCSNFALTFSDLPFFPHPWQVMEGKEGSKWRKKKEKVFVSTGQKQRLLWPLQHIVLLYYQGSQSTGCSSVQCLLGYVNERNTL